MGKATCTTCEPTIEKLLDTIGRLRPLNDEESDMLEAIIRRQRERDRARHGTVNRCRHVFTPAIDRAILAAITVTQKRSVAEEYGLTMTAIYARRNKLKERGLISKQDHRRTNALECQA